MAVDIKTIGQLSHIFSLPNMFYPSYLFDHSLLHIEVFEVLLAFIHISLYILLVFPVHLQPHRYIPEVWFHTGKHFLHVFSTCEDCGLCHVGLGYGNHLVAFGQKEYEEDYVQRQSQGATAVRRNMVSAVMYKWADVLAEGVHRFQGITWF